MTKPSLYALLACLVVFMNGCEKSHDITLDRTNAVSGVRGLEVEYLDGKKEFWPDLSGIPGSSYRQSFKSSKIKSFTFIDASQT